MRRILLAVVFFLLGGASLLFAQKAGFVNLEAKEKRELVEKLMFVTDMYGTLDFSINSIVASMPPEIRGSLRSSIKTEELLRRVVPVYERHLSKETVQALLDFYQSPAGNAWLRAQEPIMKDTMSVSKAYTSECVKALSSGK
jgi:DNA-directed RNA polymerase subunit F